MVACYLFQEKNEKLTLSEKVDMFLVPAKNDISPVILQSYPEKNQKSYEQFSNKLSLNISQKFSDGTTLLFRSFRNPALIQFLLSNKNIDINAVDKYGYTALMYGILEVPPGASSVDWRKIKEDKEQARPYFIGDSPYYTDIAGLKIRQMKSVSLLWNANPDLNIQDQFGWTALHYAVFESPTLCKILLNNGADPSLKTKLGRTALDVAKLNNVEAVEVLSQSE